MTLPLLSLLLFLFPYFLLVYFRAFTPATEGRRVLFVDCSGHREATARFLDTGVFVEKEHTKPSAAQGDFLLRKK